MACVNKSHTHTHTHTPRCLHIQAIYKLALSFSPKLTFDLALSGLLVEPLDITLLAHIDGSVDVALVEVESRFLMKPACIGTILHTGK